MTPKIARENNLALGALRECGVKIPKYGFVGKNRLGEIIDHNNVMLLQINARLVLIDKTFKLIDLSGMLNPNIEVVDAINIVRTTHLAITYLDKVEELGAPSTAGPASEQKKKAEKLEKQVSRLINNRFGDIWAFTNKVFLPLCMEKIASIQFGIQSDLLNDAFSYFSASTGNK